MIPNIKTRLHSKNMNFGLAQENHGKENKQINVSGKPLQQLIFLNRNLFTKIGANSKNCLMSPNPSYLSKNANIKAIQRENSGNRSKRNSTYQKRIKNSLDKKVQGLNQLVKKDFGKLDIVLREDLTSNKNSRNSREKGISYQGRGKTNSNLSNPIHCQNSFASIPHFQSTFYCNSNTRGRQQNLSREVNKSSEQTGPQIARGLSQYGSIGASIGLSSMGSFPIHQIGNFSRKLKNKEIFSSQRQIPSNAKNSSKMQIESEEDSLCVNSSDYPRLSSYCLLYISKIVAHLFEKEEKQIKPKRNCQNMNQEISERARINLYDTFVGIARHFRLRDRTIFLAFELIESFLSVVAIKKEDFKTLAVAALFLVSKYEEIYPPKAVNFCKILNDCITKEQILDFENQILIIFGFDLTRVIAYDFFLIFSNIAEFDQVVTNFGMFVMTLCSMEQSFYSCSNSLFAFGLCYFLHKLFKTNQFYEVSNEDGVGVYTLHVSRGKFDINRLGNAYACKMIQLFKIDFRHRDVKSVSEGIFTITQKLKENDCPNVFLKYQNDKVAPTNDLKNKSKN